MKSVMQTSTGEALVKSQKESWITFMRRSSPAIQSVGSGWQLDFDPSQFVIEALSKGSTITQYQATGIDCMDLTIAQRPEDKLFFSQSKEQDRQNGCIGHLRGDFGDGSGKGRALLLVPLLRTVRDGFPSHGSSLSKPAAAISRLKRLECVNLQMTVRMNQ